MASLKEIAREYRDEIMDGIAWVAIWKTGRSWNAKAFWLNLETERIEDKEATKQGYAECRVGIDSVNFSMPNGKTRRGRVGQEIANTLDTSCNQGIFVQVSEELVVYAVWYEKYQCYIAIRKLTPKECFRLQGWTDDYFEKAEFVNSDSQLYKQAGNGVTVTVIEAMARKLGQHRKKEANAIWQEDE